MKGLRPLKHPLVGLRPPTLLRPSCCLDIIHWGEDSPNPFRRPAAFESFAASLLFRYHSLGGGLPKPLPSACGLRRFCGRPRHDKASACYPKFYRQLLSAFYGTGKRLGSDGKPKSSHHQSQSLLQRPAQAFHSDGEFAEQIASGGRSNQRDFIIIQRLSTILASG